MSPKFELGRKLFYSVEFSKRYNTSCATCHLQTTGFAHVDHQLSHGTHGDFGIRNAPGLSNLEDRKFLTWDGRLNDLKTFAENPITDILEMDMTFEEVIVRLERTRNMKAMFNKAYLNEEITKEKILDAIYVFLINLKSENTKYDQVVVQKKTGVNFNSDEKKGYDLFKKQCATCHSGNNFSNSQFENNNLPFNNSLNDLGRYRVTKNKTDSLKFIVPSLRNVAFTFPYMHDGRFEDLEAVLNHYKNLTDKPGKLSKIHLKDSDLKYLKSFLITLTDTVFLTNPKYGFPPND